MESPDSIHTKWQVSLARIFGLLFIGLDGKIAIWDLENMQQELGNQF